MSLFEPTVSDFESTSVEDLVELTRALLANDRLTSIFKKYDDPYEFMPNEARSVEDFVNNYTLTQKWGPRHNLLLGIASLAACAFANDEFDEQKVREFVGARHYDPGNKRTVFDLDPIQYEPTSIDELTDLTRLLLEDSRLNALFVKVGIDGDFQVDEERAVEEHILKCVAQKRWRARDPKLFYLVVAAARKSAADSGGAFDRDRVKGFISERYFTRASSHSGILTKKPTVDEAMLIFRGMAANEEVMRLFKKVYDDSNKSKRWRSLTDSEESFINKEYAKLIRKYGLLHSVPGLQAGLLILLAGGVLSTVEDAKTQMTTLLAP